MLRKPQFPLSTKVGTSKDAAEFFEGKGVSDLFDKKSDRGHLFRQNLIYLSFFPKTEK